MGASYIYFYLFSFNVIVIQIIFYMYLRSVLKKIYSHYGILQIEKKANS
jgi:hypothetical protein